MTKCYDIPEIEIHVEGGVIQDVKIPKGTNAKVVVKDYDCDEDASDEGASEFVKEDEHGTYWEAVYESEEE